MERGEETTAVGHVDFGMLEGMLEGMLSRSSNSGGACCVCVVRCLLVVDSLLGIQQCERDWLWEFSVQYVQQYSVQRGRSVAMGQAGRATGQAGLAQSFLQDLDSGRGEETSWEKKWKGNTERASSFVPLAQSQSQKVKFKVALED